MADRLSGGSYLKRLWRDLGLRIETRGWVIWYLIVERGLRGLLFVAFGIYAFTYVHRDLIAVVESLQFQFDLGTTGPFWRVWANEFLLRVEELTPSGIEVVASAILVFGLVESAESIGLILRRRWAEYLVVIATGFGIPFEIREVVVHITWLRLALLIINVAVVIYLVEQKRLFRLDEEPAKR